MFTPYGYQHEAKKWILDGFNRPKDQGYPSAGLFASIGAGKTAASIMAIDEALSSGMSKRVLVIAPPRVVHSTWPAELIKVAPHLKYKILHGEKDFGDARVAQIEIQSMDSVHKLIDHAGRWDTIFVDESRNFAAPLTSTLRGRSIKKVLKKIARRSILTGTPTPEHLGELHSQMHILDGGQSLGKNVTVFRAKYMYQGGWMGRQWMFLDEMKDEILGIVAKYVLRIDATTHADYPKLITNNIWVEMPPEITREYKRLQRELKLSLERDGSIHNFVVGHAGGLYGKLKQYACGQVYFGSEKEGNRTSQIVHAEKMKALCEVLTSLYGNPSIILYHCKHDKERILKELIRQKRRVGVIDGSTSGPESARIIDEWNTRKLDNLLSHPKCLGEGLNLQFGGSDVIWFAFPDGSNPYSQTCGRIHRPGNTEGEARIHRIAMKDTVEEVQLSRIDGKIKNQEEFLLALKNFVRNA